MLRSLSKKNTSKKNVGNRNIKISNSFYTFKKINKKFSKNNNDDSKKNINNSCFLINDFKNISSTSRSLLSTKPTINDFNSNNNKNNSNKTLVKNNIRKKILTKNSSVEEFYIFSKNLSKIENDYKEKFNQKI